MATKTEPRKSEAPRKKEIISREIPGYESSPHGPPAPPIRITDLTVAYREQPVLWDLDLLVPEGVLMAIVGPNGAGKSTLIKSIMDMVPRSAGEVEVFGRPYAEVRSRIAYVPQRSTVDWDFPVSVLDVVLMGTYGALGWFKRPGKAEIARAMDALEQVELQDLAQRQISELSGGQQQRTFLARALVQGADLYLMDEPFAGVDAKTEKSLIELLKTLKDQGKTIVVVHHDLMTMRDYFDWAAMLNVRLTACGPLDEVLNDENLQRTYGGKMAFPAVQH